MKEIQKNYDVGVIVGRFQTDELTEAHKELIKYVIDRHERVLIFLGLSPCKCTVKNPLDFEARKQMILKTFPDVIILYIKDMHSDKLWSQTLDDMIDDIIGPRQSVVLYGGRDSFIDHYYGKFETKELTQKTFISATARRKVLSNKVKASADFRHGVIWATMNQWPKCIPTVDVAIFNKEYTQLLLGKKKHEDKYRFIGGFIKPGETFEDAGKREVKEEAGLNVENLKYISSIVVDDWRYRSEVDKITTIFFSTNDISGFPDPGDDIYEVRWFEYIEKLKDEIIDIHQKLFSILLNKIEPKK